MSDEDLQVMQIGAFLNDDRPGGIGVSLQFTQPGHGVNVCELLRRCLAECDATRTPEGVRSRLAQLSPRRGALTQDEVVDVIVDVYWLQSRRHLVPDDFNGTMFVCLHEGAVVVCEENPVVLSLERARRGPGAVDVTSVVKASSPVDRGAVAALRAVIDHARISR